MFMEFIAEGNLERAQLEQGESEVLGRTWILVNHETRAHKVLFVLDSSGAPRPVIGNVYQLFHPSKRPMPAGVGFIARDRFDGEWYVVIPAPELRSGPR